MKNKKKTEAVSPVFYRNFNFYGYKKKGIIMLFCLLGSVLSFANPAQKANISINVVNTSFSRILEEIESKSGYTILVRNSDIDLNEKTSLSISDKNIEHVLKTLFAGRNIKYEISGNRISVYIPQKTIADNTTLQVKTGINISGMVRDEQGESLIGVTVKVKDALTGTVTDMDGRFSLLLQKENPILVFSYMGYLTQEVSANNRNEIIITMKEDMQQLEEVIVVGYGEQKKINLTGAVASIKSKDLVKSPVASTTNALIGRLPGLIAKQTSGQPGYDAAGINIRSFGEALVIVDGVEQDFNNVDVNEIESISILKDASAAIYGARAGNGVILVTTKRGALGKPVVTLNATLTGQSYTNFPEPVNAGQYATLYREAQINSGISSELAKYSEEDIAKYFAGDDPRYPNTDWYDVIMRKMALQQQYNLTIRGGAENVKYYTFLGFLSQDGMFKGGNTGYERFNVRSNLDINITNELTMSLDLSAIKDNIRQSNRPASEEWFWMDFFDSQPTAPASYPDASKIPHIGPGPYNAIINTNEDLGGYRKIYKTSLHGALTLDYKIKPIPGLSAKMKLSYYQILEDQKDWTKQNEFWDYDYDTDTYTLYGRSNPTALKQQFYKNQTITGQLSLNYSRIFNKDHSVSGLLLFEAIDYDNSKFSAYRENYITSAIDQMFAGGTINQQADGSGSASGRISYVGRANYGYKGKYLAEITARYDGSPNFPENKRWGFFPSISLGWRMSEESFIKDKIEWIDNLKLRGGISQTGYDAIGAYQYLTGYRFSEYNVIGGKETPGLVTRGLPNKNITWETMTLYNLGLDFSFWNQKLYSEIDVFYRTRDDMLGKRTVSLPNTFGASLPDENINSQTTRGFEFVLGTRGKLGDLNYDVSGNVSWSRSKWKHNDEPEYTDPDDIRLNKKSGKWTDIVNAYVSDGLFTSQAEIDNLPYDMDGNGNKSLSPGDIKILDLNGDGKIDWRDTKEIGSGGTPHVIYGINLNLEYKGFDMSVLFQGAADYYIQLVAGNINIDGIRTPYKVIWEERWTPENNDKNAIIPRQKLGQLTNNWNSDYWYKNASYLRLKNISFGYTFKKEHIKKIRLEHLRLFVTGTNLFTINPLRKYGLDPETSDATRGWSYPVTRTISFGINVNF